IVDAHRLKQKTLRLRLGLGALFVLGIGVYGIAFSSERLRAFGPMLVNHKILVVIGVIVFAYVVAIAFRSRAHLRDAFFDFRRGWWSNGADSLFESLRLESDSYFDHESLAKQLISRGKPRSAIAQYYAALWLVYHEDEWAKHHLPELHNRVGHALVAVSDFANARE